MKPKSILLMFPLFFFLGGVFSDPAYSLGDRPRRRVVRMSPAKEAEFLRLVAEIERQQSELTTAKKIKNFYPIETLSPKIQKEIQKFEKGVKKHKKMPNSFLFQNSQPGFYFVQSWRPDFYIKFMFSFPIPTIMPGGDAFKIYLNDFNRAIPISDWPREISIVAGYRAWSAGEVDFTPTDYETEFSSEAEELTFTEGARTIDLELLPKTLQLSDFIREEDNWLDTFYPDFFRENSLVPEVIRMEMSDGTQWDVYDLDLWLALFIDPENRFQEGDSDAVSGAFGGERNNIYFFRWLGMDNVSTSSDEIPPGFYYMGVWSSGDNT